MPRPRLQAFVVSGRRMRRPYAEVGPESRRLARGGLSPSARIDFARPHAPLLMIAGELDHIMPASVIGGEGCEEVADFALAWAERAQ